MGSRRNSIIAVAKIEINLTLIGPLSEDVAVFALSFASRLNWLPQSGQTGPHTVEDNLSGFWSLVLWLFVYSLAEGSFWKAKLHLSRSGIEA